MQNGLVHTQAGNISKVTRKTVHNQWDTYIGSPVVNFGVCAKYVLICCLDCSVRFLDIRNGTPILPTLHMPKPVVQSVFVSFI